MGSVLYGWLLHCFIILLPAIIKRAPIWQVAELYIIVEYFQARLVFIQFSLAQIIVKITWLCKKRCLWINYSGIHLLVVNLLENAWVQKFPIIGSMCLRPLKLEILTNVDPVRFAVWRMIGNLIFVMWPLSIFLPFSKHGCRLLMIRLYLDDFSCLSLIFVHILYNFNDLICFSNFNRIFRKVF